MSIGDDNDRLEMNALRGKVSSVSSHETAFYPREALFWIQYSTSWSHYSEQESKFTWINQFYQHMQPYVSTFGYVNCPDGELGNNYLQSYYGSNLDRLIQIKRQYDPTNFFRFPQSIPI